MYCPNILGPPLLLQFSMLRFYCVVFQGTPYYNRFIYLCGFYHHFQHCTGHIMTGSLWAEETSTYTVGQGSVL